MVSRPIALTYIRNAVIRMMDGATAKLSFVAWLALSAKQNILRASASNTLLCFSLGKFRGDRTPAYGREEEGRGGEQIDQLVKGNRALVLRRALGTKYISPSGTPFIQDSKVPD